MTVRADPHRGSDNPTPRRVTFFDYARSRTGSVALTITLDVVALTVSVAAVNLWAANHTPGPYEWLIWLFIPLTLILFARDGLYRRNLTRNFLDEGYPIVSSVAIASLTLLGILLLVDNAHPGYHVVWTGLCAAILVQLVRLARDFTQRHLRRAHRSASATLLVGNTEMVDHLIAHMCALPEYGLRPVGILASKAPEPSDASTTHPPVPYVGSPAQFGKVARSLGIEEVVISKGDSSDDELVDLISKAHRHDIRVWVVPPVHDAVGKRARIDHLGGVPLLVLPPVNPGGWQFAMKYAMDRVVAAGLLLLISPLFLTLALLVRVGSPGPIFFRQKRVGRDGKPFDCLKFRSMRPPSASDTAFQLKAGAAPGGVEGVDRRTRVGAVMRATSLDELPQLINVLRGDMSLVGPRPERPAFVDLFKVQIHRYGQRHRVKAGLTGWAQVHGLRGQTSIADRAEWDNYYIENWSFWLDIKILILTVVAVLKRAE
ncbi:sugar transferase [Mycolicibacterium tusciae]|uniref:sugar transferase n=1 Tax=Mycolicibacterium tusciae TaxID=75922 RepID=UPI00024A36C7|nr:sugar transferase [Mycolicibacterium tusciae]